MKTIKMLHGINDGVIMRVSNERADELVSSNNASYVPKSEYKKIRDAKKQKEVIA